MHISTEIVFLLSLRPSLTYNRPYDTRPICQANSDIQQEIYCLWSYVLFLSLYRRARNQKFCEYNMIRS